MGCGHWVSTVVVAIALVGCSDFAAAEAESSGDTEGGSSTSGNNPSGGSGNSQTSAGTASASGTTTGATDPTNASNTDPTNASNTDPTNASNTDPTDPTDPTNGPSTDSESESESESETRTSDESSSGSDDETTADPTTGVMTCENLDIEPNDEGGEEETQYLGEIFCGADFYDVDGTIEDGFDDDWFAFFGDWVCGAPNPRVVIDVVDNNVEVCATPLCFQNATAIYSCVEGDNWFEGGSNLGCCSSDIIRMNVNCDGVSDESLIAGFRVRSDDAACEDYTLSYAFEVQP